eukprot:9913386-Alexandrium_andersonii.AAC.1
MQTRIYISLWAALEGSINGPGHGSPTVQGRSNSGSQAPHGGSGNWGALDSIKGSRQSLASQ